MRRGDLALHFDPAWLALSAAAVLAAYLALIWSWLFIVAATSGRRIPFLTGARIWFISALGVQLPGRIWGIVQMAAMSAEAGISPVASATSAIVNAAVNIATGMAVGVIAGAPILAIYFGERAVFAWLLAAMAIVAVIALPLIIPVAFRVLRRLHVKIPEQIVPVRAIGVSVVVNLMSWFLYGAAFLCLNRGVVDPRASSLTQHVAVYATSYVLGYLAIPFPAGIGVREVSMKGVMVVASMATPAQAGALAVVSRLWLLIILVLPALIFLAYRRPPDEKDPAAG